MGGSGSTRWKNHQKKKRVEDAFAISIHILHRYINGVAQTGQDSEGKLFLMLDGRLTETAIYINLNRRADSSVIMRLRYGIAGDAPREFDIPIALDSQPSNLIPETVGRWYFLCPECEQRRTKLYLPRGATIFACRRCHDLTYRSCQEEHKFETLLRAVALAQGLDEDAVVWAANKFLLHK